MINNINFRFEFVVRYLSKLIDEFGPEAILLEDFKKYYNEVADELNTNLENIKKPKILREIKKITDLIKSTEAKISL